MLRGHQPDERGSAAVFVVLMTVALLVAAGLVIDGGNAMAQRRKINNQAEQAARAGADSLNQASLRDGGTPRVDGTRARAAASRYLAAGGVRDFTIDVRGDLVSVSIRSEADTAILPIVGIDHIPVKAQASARSINSDTP